MQHWQFISTMKGNKRPCQKHNHQITEQYYMHENYDIHQEKSCILDDINQPFVIGAGDANETTGYIGEYAMKWNERINKMS